MGKKSESRTNDKKDGDTKVLFKKSNATMFSHSRTFSGASQLYSRSGIMQIRKNLETNQHNYYTHRGKAKRDLSVETDVCILRRYYRRKKNSLLGANSAKSRFSTLVDTECETIEEYPDTSACGDNDTDKSNPPLDIASLMIDNLKDLLNQWIQKHLIQNKDTKQKIDTVLDSLIQKIETSNNHPSSSGSTYILHKEAGKQEVKNKKVATGSLTCQYCKRKPRYVKVGSSAGESGMSQKRSSALTTTPFHYKDIRIISTLSIPRSFHKRGLEVKKEQNSSWYKMKKIKHKNLILSIDRSNKFMDSSSFDLVTISTKSLTKRSTNNDTLTKKKKRHIVFYPKPFYKSATDTSNTTHNGNLQINNIDMEKDQLETMPSLLKSLYANEPVMPDKHVQYGTKNNNSTMTESNSYEIIVSNAKVTTEIANDTPVKQIIEECLPEENENEPIFVHDFTDRIIEFPDLEKSSLEPPKYSSIKIKNNQKKTSNRGKINKTKKRQTFQSIRNKQFTYLYKKAHTQTPPGGEFLKHCQNIMQYFEEYKNKNIKLDVQINVYPTYQCKTKDVCTDISNQGIYDKTFKPTLLYNIQSTHVDSSVHMDEEPIKHKTENENCLNELTPEIIPLLDSSVCQAKFIFKVNSKEKLEAMSKANSFIERSTLTSELEIVQEISELRAVIKDLAAAAERFVNEQLKRDSNKSNAETNISRNPSNYTSSSKVEAVINLRNPSKAIQYSKEVIEKQKFLSGLKITKEPKKKETFDFYNRLAKKSTSYRIIDSESILRVTDMTSKANEMNESPTNRDNPETGHIRNTRVNKVAKKALPSSVQKSKSLFEITSEQARKRKLIALYCDGYKKSPQCGAYSVHRHSSPTSFSDKSRHVRKLFHWPTKKAPQETNQQEPILPPCICGSDTHTNRTDSMPMLEMGPLNCAYSSTGAFPTHDVERNMIAHFCDDEPTGTLDSTEEDPARLQKFSKKRRRMGFCKCCVYCLLSWITIFLLGCLFFYFYVLKDKIKPPRLVTGRPGERIKLTRRNQSSVLYVKLSDLGF